MILPEIQQLTRQRLQLFLHLVVRCGCVRRTGGLLRVGRHDPRLIARPIPGLLRGY
jgi:hypothetical protein